MLNVFLTVLMLLAGAGIGFAFGGWLGALIGFIIALALRFGGDIGDIGDIGDSCCGGD